MSRGPSRKSKPVRRYSLRRVYCPEQDVWRKIRTKAPLPDGFVEEGGDAGQDGQDAAPAGDAGQDGADGPDAGQGGADGPDAGQGGQDAAPAGDAGQGGADGPDAGQGVG